jgi:hypothetical protein
MATETLAKTHCPTCGAKLHRQDLSLCAYCGSPLILGAERAGVDDETVKRLARMRESPNFAAALEFSPRDPDVIDAAARVRAMGSVNVLAAIAFAAYALWRHGGSAWSSIPMIIAYVAALDTLVLVFAVPALLSARASSRPLLRRPALVVMRRSEMIDKGKHGTTIYYFTLRFDDGSEGEFRWKGQGTLNEPLANGATGVAYTHGERMIDFRKV